MLDNVFKKRRSIRKYTDRKITKEDLAKLAVSAFYAPTGRNADDIELVVTDDRKILDELATFKSGAAMLKGAQAAITVLSDPDVGDGTHRQDACIAATYILLKAAELGLGACWLNVCTSGPEAAEKIRHILNVPEKYNVETVISIGYPGEDRGEKQLRDMEGNVHMDTFS